MNISNLTALLQGRQKWKIFGMILVLIIVIGTLLSLLMRLAFLRDDVETRPRLAVVSTMQTPAGDAILQGAALYVEQVNRTGGFQGRPLELLNVVENSESAAKIVADKRVVAVVGHLDPAQMRAAAPRYAQAKLPFVTTLPLSSPQSGVLSLGLDPTEEARFAANYARNIQQQRLMYVIRESGSEFDSLVAPLVEVYHRFDTPVQKVWTLPAGELSDVQLQTLFDEIRNLDVGAIYLATRPELAARLVKGIRSTGNLLEIFGTSSLTTHAFTQNLQKISGAAASVQSHGIIAATPVLFDTANDDAQRFQTRYQQKFAQSPDWLAVYAFDAAHVALAGKLGTDSHKGISGALDFVDGRAQLPIQMGSYNGDNLISAPVQLAPIAKGANFNYIDALRQGRVLYVNDRFMFKTNVVYVGATVNEISEIDRQKETATLDMSIWFRYRGKFDPQDMVIENAVTPIKFGAPEESKESDDVQYRRYRIKQTFRLNFTADKRAYNQHVAGITFRHRLLNRNNLMYVVDVLGMPTGNALLADLQQRSVVQTGAGWLVDNAWVSQDLVRKRGDGAPQYVGMTGEQPLFSNITLGVLLKSETLAARDVIASEYFIYLAIFGFLGMLAAILLDMRKLGRYWGLQSWLLRVIFLPLLLLAVGNLTIDWAFIHLASAMTQQMVTVYEGLWWLMGAHLIDMAIRRFVWIPLEESAGRKVPNVMKFIVTLLIFALAFAGIVAVVLNQTLTSLLATSGVLAMVVGFAVQSNIANVFSGIILNIERPFRVGDLIKIDNVVGEVKDITWRTIRLESYDGPMVIIANSKVSESFMENLSAAPHGVRTQSLFYTQAEVDCQQVQDIIAAAVASSATIIHKTLEGFKPYVRSQGMVNVGESWVACYSVRYRVESIRQESLAHAELWAIVRQKFIDNNIPLMPVKENGSM
jgi:small-conductance mechanosensitive channel/ABC-type branched-subunit amino acid transport system substrate-binding protein